MPRAISHDTADVLVDGEVLALAGLQVMVRIRPRRSRMRLTVEPDSTLVLAVPAGGTADQAEVFVREHLRWIRRKLRLREQAEPLAPVKRFTEGESHRYLGSSFQLHLVDRPCPLRLYAGRLHLDRAVAVDVQQARRELIAWYRRCGLSWARGRLQPWAARLGVAEPQVAVRHLGRKWGAYTPDREDSGPGTVTVNWATFQLPARLIDYVLAHEIAHSLISGHGTRYWRTLKMAMPDYAARRELLDDYGYRVWVGAVVSGEDM